MNLIFILAKNLLMNTKTKYELEIPFHASPAMIFQYISDATGLSEWFANKVKSVKDIYTFHWDNEVKVAKLTHIKLNERVKFVWLNEDLSETEYFFEIKIIEDEITNDISLIIIDFAFSDEIKDEKSLWISVINDFKHIIGAV
jgi:uncharacterized protein YndB with AHSA1/START domain